MAGAFTMVGRVGQRSLLWAAAASTVAWEITWYQWEVGLGEMGPEVRESGKGDTIDQLRAEMSAALGL